MTAAIVTALVLLVIQLLLPYKPKPVANYNHLILVNEYKYKIYEIFALVPLFVFSGLICFFFYSFGNDVQEWVFADRVTDFALYPPESF